MEARKAVAEQVRYRIEGESKYLLRANGDEIGPTDATEAEILLFNLCVSLQERVDELEKALRTEWWGNHGCNPGVRYGDDGKMQCGVCITDFATMPFDELRKRVADLRLRAALSPKEGVK